MPKPRFAVLGAGSIGCHLGGHLVAAGYDVTFIGRSGAMDVLRERGLTLSTSARPPVHLTPDRLTLATGPEAAAGADFVLVTVKTAGTGAAAEDLAPHLAPGAVAVSFQNGLHNPATLRAALPGHTVLAGMVPYNVVQTEPGTVHQGMPGRLMTEPDDTLFAALREAGLAVEPRTDMSEVQHAKLLMNLNNAVNALSGLPLRDQLGQRAYRRCLALCQREALAAYRAAGITPARLGPTAPAVTPYVLGLPDAFFRRVAAATLRMDAHARSSMWEDLQRGRRTEIESLQGEIVALAAAHGRTAPANARLVELVHQAESAPRTWSGPHLYAELHAAR
ncbi:2-dehydropantoate 2-reductase [Streptomyces actinomycinicus]|uniref:2-dehydropantoate 2-reductase n=1 Tax=Streptomyces actinomycinicus TaxID=1695166 RepID=A0A937JLP6_9ACTN|nr:2-dehydropantoate 2-reductase [Streptomyces actinomycinicus]MBL1082675.1 2-dehydropantoate 2-reductase [Streptomyces actinomycinicus]